MLQFILMQGVTLEQKVFEDENVCPRMFLFQVSEEQEEGCLKQQGDHC